MSGWRSVSKDQKNIILLTFPDLSSSSCYSWPLVSLLGPSHSGSLVLATVLVLEGALISDPAAGRLHLYLESWDLSKFAGEDPQQFKGQRRSSAGIPNIFKPSEKQSPELSNVHSYGFVVIFTYDFDCYLVLLVLGCTGKGYIPIHTPSLTHVDAIAFVWVLAEGPIQQGYEQMWEPKRCCFDVFRPSWVNCYSPTAVHFRGLCPYRLVGWGSTNWVPEAEGSDHIWRFGRLEPGSGRIGRVRFRRVAEVFGSFQKFREVFRSFESGYGSFRKCVQVLEVFLEGLSQVPGGSGGMLGRLWSFWKVLEVFREDWSRVLKVRQGSGSLGSERMLCRYLEGSGAEVPFVGDSRPRELIILLDYTAVYNMQYIQIIDMMH